jgi:HSP20 family molecular chaperone IbpA
LDPTRDLLTMQERLESLFGGRRRGGSRRSTCSSKPDRYVLTIELPGMRREDVRIDSQGDTVVVSGQRPGQACCPERYQQLGTRPGPFLTLRSGSRLPICER